MKDPARILVVRMSHLGDVVCALPVFHALRDAYPEARIGWVVQPEFAPLVEGLPGLQCTFRFERDRGIAAWARLRRDLRDFRADLAVDAQGNLKSAGVMLASGAPRRVGLDASEWRERFGARAMTEHAPPSGEPHVLARGIALARHVVGDRGDLRADPALTDTEIDAGEDELLRLIGAAGAPAILHLGRVGDIRTWPADRMAVVARALAEANRPVVLLSGPAEEDAGLALARALGERGPGAEPPLRHLVGQRHLRHLAAVFAAAAARDGVFVGADSGPMHLACSVGLRTVCLEGPQDGSATGPWRAGRADLDQVLRATEEPACAPCRRRRCDHADGPVCMTGIDPGSVVGRVVG